MLKTLLTDSKRCWMQWSNRKISTNERRTTISLFMWFWLTISIMISSQLLRNPSTISTQRSRYTERSRLIWESNSSASLMSTTSARLNGRIIMGNWGNFWRLFGGNNLKTHFCFFVTSANAIAYSEQASQKLNAELANLQQNETFIRAKWTNKWFRIQDIYHREKGRLWSYLCGYRDLHILCFLSLLQQKSSSFCLLIICI